MSKKKFKKKGLGFRIEDDGASCKSHLVLQIGRLSRQAKSRSGGKETNKQIVWKGVESAGVA
jgi:hypothetical protein